MPSALVHFPASTRPGTDAQSNDSAAQSGAVSYTHAAALRAARTVLEADGWSIEDGSLSGFQPENEREHDLYLTDYDLIPFEKLLSAPVPSTSTDGANGAESRPRQPQCSSYVIRKALIRKHHLASTLHLHSVKQAPNSKGKTAEDCTPKTWHVELQYADDLDELLIDELYDLNEMLQAAQDEGAQCWFILKPGMSDRGHGIRLFNSIDMLREVLEELDAEASDSEGEAEASEEREDDDEGGMLGQLRHFVIQEYVSRPLLLDPPIPEGLTATQSHAGQGRKFHLRAYVLCVGGLQVYLFDEMLALFAPVPYSSPTEASDSGSPDMAAHLTNTCLQNEAAVKRGGRPSEENVHLWSDLEGAPVCALGGQAESSTRPTLSEDAISHVRQQVVSTVGEVFEACAKAGSIHWQMWPNAWEVFGVDLLVGWDATSTSQDLSDLRVWLLEINAQPDFAQTGERLSSIVDDMFKRSLEIAVLGKGPRKQKWKVGQSRGGMSLCFDEELIKGA